MLKCQAAVAATANIAALAASEASSPQNKKQKSSDETEVFRPVDVSDDLSSDDEEKKSNHDEEKQSNHACKDMYNTFALLDPFIISHLFRAPAGRDADTKRSGSFELWNSAKNLCSLGKRENKANLKPGPPHIIFVRREGRHCCRCPSGVC